MPQFCGRNESLVTVATTDTVAVQQRGYFAESDVIWKVSCALNTTLSFDISMLPQHLSPYERLESQSTLFLSLHNLKTTTPTNCSRFRIESLLPGSNHSVIVAFSGTKHHILCILFSGYN